jgi:hypothetical protein
MLECNTVALSDGGHKPHQIRRGGGHSQQLINDSGADAGR